MEMIGVRGRTRALELGRREGRGGAPHAGRGNLFSRVPSISSEKAIRMDCIFHQVRRIRQNRPKTPFVECPRHL